MLEYAMNYNSVFIEGAALLRLRPACASDCKMIWEWAAPEIALLFQRPDPVEFTRGVV